MGWKLWGILKGSAKGHWIALVTWKRSSLWLHGPPPTQPAWTISPPIKEKAISTMSAPSSEAIWYLEARGTKSGNKPDAEKSVHPSYDELCAAMCLVRSTPSTHVILHRLCVRADKWGSSRSWLRVRVNMPLLWWLDRKLMSFGQRRRVSKQSNKYQRRNCCMKEKQKKKKKEGYAGRNLGE